MKQIFNTSAISSPDTVIRPGFSANGFSGTKANPEKKSKKPASRLKPAKFFTEQAQAHNCSVEEFMYYYYL